MDNEFDLDLDFLNQSEKDDFNKVDDADSSNEGVDTDDTQLTEEEKKIIVDNTTNDNDANAAKTATDTADTTDDNKDSQNNNINTYFEFLVEQGLLDVEDDYKFDGKEETLETLKATTFKNQRQDFMNEV
jgi:hypothetical protein